MKKMILTLAVCVFIAGSAFAQEAKQAAPADVASIDSIITALYDVISGDKDKKRDWDRFRSLFYKDARLIPAGKNPQTGVVGANSITPEEYITRAEPLFARDGFHEREIARKTDVFGNVAQVFSTYEAFRTSKDEKPFIRGINSIQLLNDGKRWWVLTIYWQAETADDPIPEKYMKN